MTDGLTNRAILLAHDHPKVRASLARALTGAGYEVVEAGLVDEGFDALYAERPALAIVDARLRDSGALKLGLAANARGAKVIVLDAALAPSEATLTMRVFAAATVVNRANAVRALTKAVTAAIGAPAPTPHAA